MIPFILDALDCCCGDGCKFSHAHGGFMLIPNKQKNSTKRVVQGEHEHHISPWKFNKIISVFKQNTEKGKWNHTISKQ